MMTPHKQLERQIIESSQETQQTPEIKMKEMQYKLKQSSSAEIEPPRSCHQKTTTQVQSVERNKTLMRTQRCQEWMCTFL